MKLPTTTSSADNSRSGWPAQPVDIVHGDKLGMIDYARSLLQFKCLDRAGYPQNLRLLQATPGNPVNIGVSARTWVSSSDDEARRHGFGHDSAGEPAWVVSYDSSYDRALDECGKEANVKLGPGVATVTGDYYDLVNKLAPYRREVKATDELGTSMADCLTKAGVRIPERDAFIKTLNPQLLGVPFGTLAPGEESRWKPQKRPGTVQVGSAIPPRKYIPTPKESDLAVTWRHCQIETHVVDQLLTAAYAVQQRYVNRYKDQFAKLNPKLDALAKTAADLVAAQR